MRLASLIVDESPLLAAQEGSKWLDLSAADASLGRDVGELLRSGSDWAARAAAAMPKASALSAEPRFRPLVPRPAKIVCLGLNDYDHAREAGYPVPEFPDVFLRVPESLLGHNEPLLRPLESTKLDYEVELAAVIGVGGRRISEADALAHVAGYSVFNDGSIRNYQMRTTQWTLGKNFIGTGVLGPALVTPDELPEGASGLRLTTRVGEELLQEGNTGSMVFGVAKAIALLSEVFAFEPGDVIAFGTPSGIGGARKPPRWLLPGERIRVAVEQIGELSNPIVDEAESKSK